MCSVVCEGLEAERVGSLQGQKQAPQGYRKLGWGERWELRAREGF